MALNPTLTYPSQTAVHASYPYGKARNETTLGDGTGTPFEEQLVNDIWGFQQALLAEGSVVPDNSPDTGTASQYLTALKAVIDGRADDRINAICITNRAHPIVIGYNPGSPTGWTYADPTSGSTSVIEQQSLVNTTCVVQLSNHFADAAIFANGLRVWIKPAGGHGGLPATMPRVRLYKTSVPSGSEPTATLLADKTDDSGSVSAYEDYHDIQPTFALTNLLPLESYFVKLTGEASTNAIVGLGVYAITWSLTLQ